MESLYDHLVVRLDKYAFPDKLAGILYTFD